MTGWGGRRCSVLFLIAGPLGAIGLSVRLKLVESLILPTLPAGHRPREIASRVSSAVLLMFSLARMRRR